MRTRMIKPGERDRLVLRTNSSMALCRLVTVAIEDGFEEVGFVAFWWRLIFPRKKNDQETK